ncbi:hypothetical protein NQ314_005481 [Rhamnusium bicolor]|uniref:MCM10 OB-fold domain-containing protein n=1 Tax=Rhamnusium bicolor TaxID=1586634 RepID=A0AAV8ZH81_9CUCU|nr:hypothetical protein NQ314_005481 [Rhamnusium bicolor]
MSQEDDLLDHLLSAATEELENLSEKGNALRETDIFKNETNLSEKRHLINNLSSGSVIHNGDTNSSDDEGNRNFEDKKYTECGREIKHLLGNTSSSSTSPYSQKSSTWKTKATFTPSDEPKPISKIRNEKTKANSDVYTDPIFGMRIINPLISSTVLKERMVGREAVPFARVNRHLQIYGKEKDWVIAGVVANKSVKTSQKGSQFCIWTLTDLKDDIKTVSLFLFSSAHKQLWKTVVGTVVGILNPNVLDKRDGSKDEVCSFANS